MTIHILAYPEEESKRLDKVVLAMPIDADGDLIDGKPERLPKQISRYLLPERFDPKSRELLDDAIHNFMNDLGSTNRRKASITSPPLNRHSSTTQSRNRTVPVEIHQAKTSPTSGNANPIERERKPYAGTPAASDASSNNEEPIRIERDRAPYTAKEGSGKVHAENARESSTRLGRSNSTATRNTRADIPETRHNRAPSISNQYMPPPRSGQRRPSSPPLKNFSNSTPNDIHNASKYGPDPSSSSSSGFTNQSQSFNPGSYGSTGSFPPPPPPIDHRRSRDERSYRRDPEEDVRFPGEFSSPRDAEKWDRYQDIRGGEPESRFDRPYERPSIPIDPREARGAPPDDWYREKGRGSDYEPFGTRRY